MSLPGGDSAQPSDQLSDDRRPDERPYVVCARCGAMAEVAPLTWSYSVEDGVGRHVCDSCARAHIRAIEARLDSDWW
ncbi:hypothetical protein [Streptomyces sp. NPDC046939]|uniref:hypothetical protein n=1 Tax=Streptomyces sp. NPDC046939 TaxID=3155376 RepID=UPI0033F90FB7